MKKSSKRTLSRMLAGTMLVSSLFAGAVSVQAEEAPLDTYKTVLMGDADGDGIITANDASIAYRLDVDAEFTTKYGDLYDQDVVDMDGDGLITAADAAIILQMALTGKKEEKDNTSDGIKIYVVGDSTACHYGPESDTNYWFKRVGFGDGLQQYMTDDVEVINLALSGRSSKSFATGINENGNEDAEAVANYAQFKNDIKSGDYLIIAWGHNDEKTDKYRFTDATKDINDETSFKWSLYNRYIKIAQDAGATPILCTPIVRRGTGSARAGITGNDIHQPAGLGDYGQCVRDLASELNITLIDNLANTKALWEELGKGADVKEVAAGLSVSLSLDNPDLRPDGYAALHAAVQDAGVDNTHLNRYGADMVAYMMARDIKASSSTLAQYVKDGIEAPTFDNDKVINKDWVPFDEGKYIPSSIWKVTEPWAGSVFGASVGEITEDSHPSHDIVEVNGPSEVYLKAAGSKGKIASNCDGLVMYFRELDKDQDFTLTATAHIENYTPSVNQTAFGLMLRDNVFSDTNYNTNAHYVAVGNTSQTTGRALVSVWRRGTKTPPEDPSAEFDANKNLFIEQTRVTAEVATDNDSQYTPGTEVALKLEKKDGVYTLQYGDEAPVTATVDEWSNTDLTAKNPDKVFAGIFVARACEVTFKDIQMTLY